MRPPDSNWYKVNVDGAIFKESSSCGVRVIIRNEEGISMGAMSKKFPFSLGALEVEEKAAEEGILLAKDFGLKDVIVEGDAKIVMSALSNPNSDTLPCSIQLVVEGAKS